MHALTIDVEDWHQLVHRRLTGEDVPPTAGVVRDTHRVLDLLDEAGTRATFFVVGSVADAFPALVREVARRGHEVGSHTWSHRLIPALGRDGFRADLERSVASLRDVTGEPVAGFRAPEFSVGPPGHWCFEVLAEAGFVYDSSVFPLPGPRYGIAGAPRVPFRIDTPAGPLAEYPLATWDWGGRRLPVAGSWFRLLPGRLLHRAMQALEAEGRPAVLYFHPYEFHAGRLWPTPGWGRKVRARTLPFTLSRLLLNNVRTGAIARQLASLLRRFRFGTLGDLHRSLHPLPATSAHA